MFSCRFVVFFNKFGLGIEEVEGETIVRVGYVKEGFVVEGEEGLDYGGCVGTIGVSLDGMVKEREKGRMIRIISAQDVNMI